MALFMVIVRGLCMLICSRGLQNGVEKVTKVMMLCLLALMVVLVFRSVTLEGAGEGLKFYLMPNFHNLAYDANGNFILGEAVYAAMGHAFFTLSLGIALWPPSAATSARNIPGRRGPPGGRAGYLCGLYRGPDHLPRLLCL